MNGKCHTINYVRLPNQIGSNCYVNALKMKPINKGDQASVAFSWHTVLYPFRYTAWLGCFLGSAGFNRCVEKQQEKLQEFSHSHNREPNPETQLTADIGHEILNLLKGKDSHQVKYQNISGGSRP